MFPIYDALIIGGGPAGSLCAIKLAELGMKVLLLESQKAVKRKVCGEYLSPSGVSLLIDQGLKKELVDPFLPIQGMKIVPADGEPIPTEFPERNGIALNRQVFDETFLELARKAGVSVRLDSKVSTIKRMPTSWQIGLVHGESFQTRLLIGADGRNSTTAKALGLKKSVDTSRVALHCHIPTSKKNKRFGEMHLFKDGSYIGIDPTGDFEINISLCCASSKLKGNDLHIFLNKYILNSSELSKLYGPVPIEVKINTVSPITNKMPTIIGKNAVLIGDAAGFIDPLTGEGMYNALWMATSLVEEIKQSREISLFNYQSALEGYSNRKKFFFRQKSILNNIFQFIIKKPILVNILAKFIRKKQTRANVFVGIIGNIYRPIEGIVKLFRV